MADIDTPRAKVLTPDRIHPQPPGRRPPPSIGLQTAPADGRRLSGRRLRLQAARMAQRTVAERVVPFCRGRFPHGHNIKAPAGKRRKAPGISVAEIRAGRETLRTRNARTGKVPSRYLRPKRRTRQKARGFRKAAGFSYPCLHWPPETLRAPHYMPWPRSTTRPAKSTMPAGHTLRRSALLIIKQDVRSSRQAGRAAAISPNAAHDDSRTC